MPAIKAKKNPPLFAKKGRPKKPYPFSSGVILVLIRGYLPVISRSTSSFTVGMKPFE